jgi:hypothetical protein
LVSKLEDKKAAPFIPLAANAFMHTVLICWCHSQILELYHISEGLLAVFIF